MLDLAPLLGEEQRLIFETATQVLRDVRTRIGPDLETDQALHELWRAVSPEWLEYCLLEPSADVQPFSVACTLAESHGYAGLLNPLGTAILAARLVRDAGSTVPIRPAPSRVSVMPAAPLPPDADGAQPALATYEIVRDRYYVTVHGAWVPYARPLADLVVLPARGETVGAEPALFAVPTNHPALAVERLPTSGGSYLCRVEMKRSNIEPPLSTGPRVLQALRRHDVLGAVLAAAELAGLGRAALEMTLEYAKHRVQFGRPIGSFQAVHHHLADMLRDLTSTRLLVAQAASRLDRGLPVEREASMAKAKAAEAVSALLRMAHQITGGVGYYRDYPLEGYLRRSIDAQAAFGNALHHRRRLARLLQQDPIDFRGPDAHPPQA